MTVIFEWVPTTKQFEYVRDGWELTYVDGDSVRQSDDHNLLYLMHKLTK